MATDRSSVTPLPDSALAALQKELTLAEYSSLRAEILKLIELQSQFLAITVVAFGTITSVGFQAKNERMLLIHPLLALILGVLWMNNAHSISRCARYLRKVESIYSYPNLGWEQYVAIQPHKYEWIGVWGVRAMFACTAVLALAASLGIRAPHGVGWVLFVGAAVVTLIIIALSVWWRESGGDDKEVEAEKERKVIKQRSSHSPG
jgi:hypothetical protein